MHIAIDAASVTSPDKYLDMIKLAPIKTPMKLSLSDEDKLTLERWVKSRATEPKQKQSAKIILMTAARLPTAEIMDKLQLSNPTLNLWRNRYVELGLAGER